MDGVEEMDNVLLMGLTNRRDLIDEALLRPGRLEVHLEIRPPDAPGRRDILRIHLRRLRNTRRLDPEVWDDLDRLAAGPTEGLTGAQLAGLVRSAASFALDRVLHPPTSPDSPPQAQPHLPRDIAAAAAAMMRVEAEDMERALLEIRAAAPAAPWWARLWPRRRR